MRNDFFVRARRGRAARQDAAIVFRPAPEEPPQCIRYALTPAGEALLREWEASRASSSGLGGAR
jgi:hypothetical protein